MCFGSKDHSTDPPPKPAQIPQQSSSSSAPPSKARMDYAPPPGPPPSHAGRSTDYAPPQGPPPSKSKNPFGDFAPPSQQDYEAPLGPPPSKKNPYDDDDDDDFAPPPGPPPPAEASGPKKAHDWEEAVPDTSLLPPPPAFFNGFDRSPTNNATEEEAEAGERWVRDFPLYAPMGAEQSAVAAALSGNLNCFAPPFYRGTLAQVDLGVWRGQSASKASDTCIATYPPLYIVAAHSPLATGQRRTVYYEVNVLGDSRRDEVSLALGFNAPPYPAFRLPGWHRGSLAVHGDDGHRYVNDRWGGNSFTAPFKRGETVGLGMDLEPGAEGGIVVEIFHTREGRETGRWDLHQETDREQDLPVTGLEGFHDLCAAVGVFDKVSFELVFAPGRWKWKGHQA